MKILIVTASNLLKDAGIVGLDILNGLSQRKENEIMVLVKDYGKYSDPRIISIETKWGHKIKIIRKFYYRVLHKLFRTLTVKHTPKNLQLNSGLNPDYYFDQDISKTHYSTKDLLKRVHFKPDIILVLFMKGFISFKNIQELNERTGAIVFLYLMDMAAMTGGCHYAWSCEGYLNECGACPAIKSSDKNDLSRKNFLFKEQFVSNTDISLIAASEYQFQQLKKSRLFKKKPKFKVLIGINEEVFKPSSKKTVRKELGLPINKKIIFFGAVGINSKRKGFAEMVETLKILRNDLNPDTDVHLIIAGQYQKKYEFELPFPFTVLGYLNHHELALAFQSADVFLCSSIEDSGPMMINQSIMSGTPVVSFEMGVGLDLVKPGITGYIAKIQDCVSLAAGINKVFSLDEDEYGKMEENCRKLATSNYSISEAGRVLYDIFKSKLRDNEN